MAFDDDWLNRNKKTVTGGNVNTKKNTVTYDPDLAGALWDKTNKMLVTRNEFNRTGYGYKDKYGTYENYLNEMRSLVNAATAPETQATVPETQVADRDSKDLSNYRKESLADQYKNQSLSTLNSIYDTQSQAAQDAYDIALNSLTEQQRAVLEALGLTKRNQERGAYVNFQKLLKYLPEYLQKSGLAGLGISPSAVIDAYGQYQNALNAIEESIQNNRTEYETQRLADVASLEQNRANALANYNLQKAQAESGVYDNYYAYLAKLNNANDATGTVSPTSGANLVTGSSNSGDFTDGAYGSDDVYASVANSGSSGTSGSKVNVIAEKAKTNNGKNTIGDGFTLGIGSDWDDRKNDNLSATIDGKKYKLQTGDALTKKETEEVKSALGGKVSPNTVLLYDGKLVVSTDSGGLRYVKNKDFMVSDYNDLMKYLKS